MPSSNQSSSSATVVKIAGFRRGEKLSPLNLSQRAIYKNGSSQKQNAELLSVRRHLSYQASVEIDRLEVINSDYGVQAGAALVKQVRELLNKEFGSLRVHKSRNLFVIRHRSVEGIISSLLRVQFFAHQLELPIDSVRVKPVSNRPITLTWGVGRTTTEAEVERLRRRRQKIRR